MDFWFIKKNNRGFNKKFAEEWIRKAQDDELAIKAILKEKGPFSIACFLSQQMAEKYLKGYLIFQGEKFRKVYDLNEILTRCLNIDKKFKDLKKESSFLNQFYIATRYPGDFSEGISEKEADQALEKAEKIKEFVLEKFNENI